MNDDDSEIEIVETPDGKGKFVKKYIDKSAEQITQAAKLIYGYMLKEDPSLAPIVDHLLEGIFQRAFEGAMSPVGDLLNNFAIYILATSDNPPSQNALSQFQKIIQGGSIGGKAAAKNRAAPREKVKVKIKALIGKRGYWDSWGQSHNLQSITTDLWLEIEQAINNGRVWEGISSDELHKSQIGRQTVYEAVKETDPR